MFSQVAAAAYPFGKRVYLANLRGRLVRSNVPIQLRQEATKWMRINNSKTSRQRPEHRPAVDFRNLPLLSNLGDVLQLSVMHA
jgi:hypothetical protein